MHNLKIHNFYKRLKDYKKVHILTIFRGILHFNFNYVYISIFDCDLFFIYLLIYLGKITSQFHLRAKKKLLTVL